MDSVNKYGSDGIPFDGKIAEIKPAEQQIQQMIDALAPTIQAIIDAIVPIIKQCIDVTCDIWGEILKSHPDKRVVWLALYHKKEKVRKKNRNRIAKYFAKVVCAGGNQTNR